MRAGWVGVAAGLVAAWGALGLASAEGGVFRFEDESGTVHYTNVPHDPRYRFFQPTPEPVAEVRPADTRPPGPQPWPTRFAEAIRTAAERYRVDRRLVEAVITVESAGNPTAVSRKGAQGLMQLMPQRAAELGVKNPFDPQQNVDGGVRHLRDLLQRFAGNVTLALAAYNAGEAAVRSYQGVPPFPETQDYVRKIRALYAGNGVSDPMIAAPVASAPTTPQVIYQDVSDDGAVTFTNLPPRSATSALQRSF